MILYKNTGKNSLEDQGGEFVDLDQFLHSNETAGRCSAQLSHLNLRCLEAPKCYYLFLVGLRTPGQV
jgi:hypothetical protein